MPPLSREEREQFLSEPHIGAVAVEAGPDRGPLVVPVWYDYEPGGELWFVTGADSRKAKLIETAGRFSLLVERLEPTVRYVSVEGPVTRTREATLADVESMARRYLGDGADAYLANAPEVQEPSVLIHLRPTRWNTADLGTV